jgi:ribosomal protein S18 acetylase RimI-like enzyme
VAGHKVKLQMEVWVEGVARWGGSEVHPVENVPGTLLFVPRRQWLVDSAVLPDMEALTRENASRALRLGAWPEAVYVEGKRWLELRGWKEEGSPFDCYDLWIAPRVPVEVPALPEDAEHVNAHWELGRGSDTLPTVRSCIALRPSAAVACVATGVVVAFALTRHDGSIGAVTVLAEHRRKGLGSCCVAALVTELAGKTYVMVDSDNIASCVMHEKLGFVNTKQRFAWAFFTKAENEAS